MQNAISSEIFNKYFDCFLPELRYYNHKIWVRVMLIYKLIIPSVYLLIFIYYYHDMCTTYKLEGLANFLLLIVGFENGIAAFAWLISEGLSIYSLGLSILQYCIMRHQDLVGCADEMGMSLYIFNEFNETLFMFSAGVNLRIMIPVLILVFIFCLLTCSLENFLKLFRREQPVMPVNIGWQEYQGDQEIECSICLEIFKKKDHITKLGCEHQFHYKCLKKWKKEKHTCPNCRSEMP